MQPDKQKVLVCPLDWGLGHASRMIPIIDRLIECDYQVIIGGSGKSGKLLKTTYPELPFISIAAPVIRYSRSGMFLVMALIFQLPRMIFSAIREHHLIKNIVLKHGVKFVISDNRYGLFCRQAYCIFITHQISPVLPKLLSWLEYPLYLIIRKIIIQYNECWIPDFASPENNLSGKLSHRYKLPCNARYIGILSRFTGFHESKNPTSSEEYKLVVVSSGPEPQLSIFNKKIIGQALTIPFKILVITGLAEIPVPTEIKANNSLTLVSHLDPYNFEQTLVHAGLILCRAGYSSIMDLVAIGKPAILVPTPGQPEQFYLAEYLSDKGWFSYINQHETDLSILVKSPSRILSIALSLKKDSPEYLPIPIKR